MTEVNDIKTYNLSHGKTIPEWLSDRKKRLLLKKDVDLRRRIQLIQDFEMPTLSSTVNVSNDGQYIIATGIYKPRVRCYDVNQLALKFERCLDSEVIKCLILSDDYSKLLFLEEDRYVELHSQFGFYYKTRIPKFGRDMAYNYNTCDALFVGNGSEIYRLNLEVGTFLKSFETEANTLNAIQINPVHNLMVVGSQEGFVEAWDPRIRERVATLDCAYDAVRSDMNQKAKIPSVTTLTFRDGLTMAVGTATGQIMLYDIRSNKPYLTKDHMYGLPIKSVSFLDGTLDLIASLDAKIIKFWNRNTGAPYTAIQSDRELNQLAAYPNSGMLFVANEAEKILSYYIPAIGPAPKWCSFLDRITEELEESNENTIYDDYKFVTEQELDEIGLIDLIGTNLLRAYMHGYFIDMRLYRKARDASQPFAYEEYRKKKIREKIESERIDRVRIEDKLPKVNRTLAERILLEEQQQQEKRSKKYKANPMKDERFSAMFSDPDFQIDELSEEFRLLNPVLARMSQPTNGSNESKPYANIFEEDKMDSSSSSEQRDSSDENSSDEVAASNDDESITPANVNSATNAATTRVVSDREQSYSTGKVKNKTRLYHLKSGKSYDDLHRKEKREQSERNANRTFEQRLKRENRSDAGGESIKLLHGGIGGNRVMTFVPKTDSTEKTEKEEARQNQLKTHLKERRSLVRRASGLRFSRKNN